MNRAVFLDRDGVLNKAVVRHGRPHPPADVSELVVPEEVPRALRTLRAAGYRLVVVTNQPDVARGTCSREVVDAIHDRLRSLLPLDAVYASFEDGDHPRRKPNPGMLLEAAADWQLDLPECWLVGDRWKDVLAGQRAGCRTIFLDHDYDEPRPAPPAEFTVRSLTEATERILPLTTRRGAA